jgi:hypothetical protein
VKLLETAVITWYRTDSVSQHRYLVSYPRSDGCDACCWWCRLVPTFCLKLPAQAVGHRPLSTVSHVRSKGRRFGFCRARSDTGIGFSPSTSVFASMIYFILKGHRLCILLAVDSVVKYPHHAPFTASCTRKWTPLPVTTGETTFQLAAFRIFVCSQNTFTFFVVHWIILLCAHRNPCPVHLPYIIFDPFCPRSPFVFHLKSISSYLVSSS